MRKRTLKIKRRKLTRKRGTKSLYTIRGGAAANKRNKRGKPTQQKLKTGNNNNAAAAATKYPIITNNTRNNMITSNSSSPHTDANDAQQTSTITIHPLKIMITTNSAATGGKDAAPQQFNRSMLYLTEEMKSITRARDRDTARIIQEGSTKNKNTKKGTNTNTNNTTKKKKKVIGGDGAKDTKNYIGQLDLNRISDLPYFTMDYEYPVSYLAKLPYQSRINFFFIRARFLNGITKYGTKTSNKEENARHNIMHMLRLLFPTSIIVSDNQVESNKVFVQRNNLHLQGSNFGRALAQTYSRSWVPNSYLKLSDGNVYTIAKVIWQNDVLNHPIYRNLINESLDFIEWCVKQRAIILGNRSQVGELTKLKQKLTEILLKEMSVKYRPGDIVMKDNKKYMVRKVNNDNTLNLVFNSSYRSNNSSAAAIMDVPWEEVDPDEDMFKKMFKKTSPDNYCQSFALTMKEEFINMLHSAFEKNKNILKYREKRYSAPQSDNKNREMGNLKRGIEYFRQLDYLFFKKEDAPTSENIAYNFEKDYEAVMENDEYGLTDSTYPLRESYDQGEQVINVEEINKVKVSIINKVEELKETQTLLTRLESLKNGIENLNKIDKVKNHFSSTDLQRFNVFTTQTPVDEETGKTIRVTISVLLDIFASLNLKEDTGKKDVLVFELRDIPLNIEDNYLIIKYNETYDEFVQRLPTVELMIKEYEKIKTILKFRPEKTLQSIFDDAISFINGKITEEPSFIKKIKTIKTDLEKAYESLKEKDNFPGNSAYDYIMLTRSAYKAIKSQLQQSPNFLKKFMEILDNILLVITHTSNSILDAVSRDFSTFISRLVNECKNIRVLDEIARNYLDINHVNPNLEDSNEMSKDTNPIVREVFKQLKTDKFKEYTRFAATLKHYTNPEREIITNPKLQEMIDDYVKGLRPVKDKVHLTEFMQQVQADFVNSRKNSFQKKTDAMNELTYVGVNLINMNGSSEAAAEIFLQIELIKGEVTEKNAGNISCAYKDAQLASDFSSLIASQPTWQSSIPGYIMDARTHGKKKESSEN